MTVRVPLICWFARFIQGIDQLLTLIPLYLKARDFEHAARILPSLLSSIWFEKGILYIMTKSFGRSHEPADEEVAMCRRFTSPALDDVRGCYCCCRSHSWLCSLSRGCKSC